MVKAKTVDVADRSFLGRDFLMKYGKFVEGLMTGTALGFLLWTDYEKHLIIACPDCLDRQNNRASNKTLLLGWLGFPGGIMNMIRAISLNNKMKQGNRIVGPNDLLKSFVISIAGRIEASKDNNTELQSLLKYLD